MQTWDIFLGKFYFFTQIDSFAAIASCGVLNGSVVLSHKASLNNPHPKPYSQSVSTDSHTAHCQRKFVLAAMHHSKQVLESLPHFQPLQIFDISILHHFRCLVCSTHLRKPCIVLHHLRSSPYYHPHFLLPAVKPAENTLHFIANPPHNFFTCTPIASSFPMPHVLNILTNSDSREFFLIVLGHHLTNTAISLLPLIKHAKKHTTPDRYRSPSFHFAPSIYMMVMYRAAWTIFQHHHTPTVP